MSCFSDVGDPVIDVHLGADDVTEALRDDVLRGLTSEPKELPPKWFYDERGSALFDEITRLDEYYPTEAEREILIARATEIVETAAADTIVELGSGTSDKSRVLLDAAHATGRLRKFVPFDVSEPFLRDAAAMLAERYRGLEVHGVVGDFDHHLPLLPGGGRRLVVLLGGTIGNYEAGPRADFLQSVARQMSVGDHLLLGVDLVKDRDRLVRAYDDRRGVTAAFNKNVLAVINRELDADFDLDQFDHVARFDPEAEQIEMLLRSRRDQKVAIDELDLTVGFEAGETMRTEVSAKFRRSGIGAELEAVGLHPVSWWTDDAEDFAMVLACREEKGTELDQT